MAELTNIFFFFFCGGGVRTNERPGTDHVTSEPMIGLKITAPDGAQPHNYRTTDEHGDSMTESAQWGRFSKKGLGQFTF